MSVAIRSAMSTTIDAAGRLVLPKPMRDALGLTSGSKVQLQFDGETVTLRPEHAAFTIDRGGEIPTVSFDGDTTITDAEMFGTLDDVRNRR